MYFDVKKIKKKWKYVSQWVDQIFSFVIHHVLESTEDDAIQNSNETVDSALAKIQNRDLLTLYLDFERLTEYVGSIRENQSLWEKLTVTRFS